MNDVRRYAADLAERAGWTFAQGAATTLAAAQLTSWHQLKDVAVAASVAGGMAVLALVKGVLAGTRTGTASTLRVQAVSSAEKAGVNVLEQAELAAQHIFPTPVEPAAAPTP